MDELTRRKHEQAERAINRVKNAVNDAQHALVYVPISDALAKNIGQLDYFAYHTHQVIENDLEEKETVK